MTDRRSRVDDEEALNFHRYPKPGKLAMSATKPMATQRDLSLAYSPGVAAPVKAIAEDPDLAYDYTSKGNMVAVISNGTAILGLGDLGAMASKPVMEGKSVLFKRFADVDSIDIEVDESDPEAFIECVRRFGASFGGINLEDIKGPDCFIIEEKLREYLDIPVFHDDQHGTAIISAAGIINACELSGKDITTLKVVVNGAGAAGIAVLELIKAMGVKHDNAILCDSKGVIYKGRDHGMNQWKSAHAADTEARTLEEAMSGADCFIGLSVKGAVTKEMVRSMAADPIIFAMANPDPEITPEEVREARSDAIMATGRSDYPNQVNNVLGFPYIFRGALDVRARTINEDMKIAAAQALAELAREDVPDEVAAAYHGARPTFGKDYIIPAPFDPRLISHVPPYVAQAAMDSGVARKPIADMDQYKAALARRLDPTAAILQSIHDDVRACEPKTIVFAEGEEPSVIRAAYAFQNQGLGEAILIGREETVHANMRLLGVQSDAIRIVNARLSDKNADYADFLFKRLQRRGYLRRDVQRLVNNDRNVFAACMVALGDANGMVTGVTRNYAQALGDVKLVLDTAENERVMGMSLVLSRGRTLFIADTNVTEFPSPEALADIAVETAAAAKRFGVTPRVAFLSYSTFGNPSGDRADAIQKAVSYLDERGVDFEYEGEMNADVALDPDHRRLYPFSRLSGPANVLVMPAIHSASIATKLMRAAGGATVLGPMLVGLEKPVQIARLGASVNDILTLAALAAHDLSEERAEKAAE
ncbi:MAG: NADP-dependent malic enzyme [Oceanicaulis sp.]|uniref:NADP-dependent malic enzyme n=1 Tax=unclassified Oceanicaulis TaxID=2632123 RepID=UPI000C53105B|nr:MULTISPECIES: NADP-dependent malic enzyme [unclassified Oceanicaulis]MAB68309.1 NADP-dependent malic enzyme [Oceanicaulis sp.]MBC38651.1 NADP-dependent malic enzyme [Oceanicaulis sp.]MBG36662.1 NADP-dependent malic enzyme [Oceanicaulis sp.]HCR95781.1 NADP-dependent malic enzyme [Oceanicaulis sp.]|tara:strand:- start:2263 stop:4551 length:2289 start_codon:yes stop_codon:yes gene_type:complete